MRNFEIGILNLKIEINLNELCKSWIEQNIKKHEIQELSKQYYNNNNLK